METPFILLKYVGKALLQAFPGGGLVAEMLVEAAPEVAKYLCGFLTKKTAQPKEALVEAVAKATPRQLRGAVEEIVAEIAAELPEEARRVLATYLLHVPASLRRALRRDSDPTGTTVPAGLSLRKP